MTVSRRWWSRSTSQSPASPGASFSAGMTSSWMWAIPAAVSSAVSWKSITTANIVPPI
jgi:hypothetical protein